MQAVKAAPRRSGTWQPGGCARSQVSAIRRRWSRATTRLSWGKRPGSHPRRLARTTAPLVAGERVFVMGVDRVVNAFDALDGTLLWTLKRPGDALTLAQRGVVAAFRDTLLVGQGARLTGVDPLSGACVGAGGDPRGRTRSNAWLNWSARCGWRSRLCALPPAVAASTQRATLVWSANRRLQASPRCGSGGRCRRRTVSAWRAHRRGRVAEQAARDEGRRGHGGRTQVFARHAKDKRCSPRRGRPGAPPAVGKPVVGCRPFATVPVNTRNGRCLLPPMKAR
jgi:hypothetical protein